MLFAPIVVLAAAVAVSASPVEKRAASAILPLKHITNVKSAKNIVGKGQARLSNVNGVEAASVSSGSVTNEDVTYVAPVVVGGKTWELIVDTGCKSLPQTNLETHH